MRIVLMFLVAALFISCSKEESDTTFNPPQWLQGVWKHEYTGAFLNKYIITSNNIVLEYKDGERNDYSQFLSNNNIPLRIDERSDTKYSYTFEENLPNYENYSVTFKKVSDTLITLSISTGVYNSPYHKID